ncbi:MAG: class I SAM-dependent methyltransferase [Actinomycetales bacterium]|nr:class I SAM-dependent methyltransferase [Actinomycetales bacterium]
MPELQQRRARRAASSARTAVLWAAVRELVETSAARLGRPLRVLDLGGGTGELAVPLAELGPTLVADVTVVDPSPDALAALGRRAGESGVQDRVQAHQGDADTLAELLPGRQFDLVCCHGVLEIVDDPVATLRVLAGALVDDGHLSLLVAGRLAAVWARALAGELEQACTVLTSADGRWGLHDPLPRRFDLAQLRELVVAAGLELDSWHGTRLLGDLVPSNAIDTEADRAALLGLEEALAGHPAYPFLGELGAGLHLLARRA